MKRILSLLLALTFIFSCASSVYAETENGEPVKVKIQVYSNLNGQKGVSGLYCDNAFYVTPGVICALANGTVSQSDKDSAAFSFFDGLVSVTVDTHDKTIPAMTYNNRLYISAAHFLRYMGFAVSFADGAEADIHMFVYRQYTVMDALAEYINYGCRFSWSEADGAGGLTRVLSALDTALLGYDPNIFRCFPGMSGVDSVEKGMDIDMLRLILGSWNTDYLSGDDPALTVLNADTDLSRINFDDAGWYGYLEQAAGKNAMSEADVLSGALGAAVFDTSSGVIGAAAEQAGAIELFKQFSNMARLGENILGDSLGRIDHGSSFYKQRPELFEAAGDVMKMFDGSFKPELLGDIFSDALKTGMPAAGGASAAAWSMFAALPQNDEAVRTVVSNETSVACAGVCANIEMTANSMVRETCGRLSGTGNPGPLLSESVQERLRSQMALSLKASLTAREQLLASGRLEANAASEMERACHINAAQLGRIINAQPLEIDGTPRTDEDLSWIALLTVSEIYGHAVEYNGDLYYWKYTGDSYEGYGSMGSFPISYRAVNQMVRRGADGNVSVLFEAKGANEFAVSNDRIYYQSCDEISVWDMSTRGVTSLGKGKLVGVTDDGNYLICSGDGNLDTIDTHTARRGQLVAGASFIACWDGVIYYQPAEADYGVSRLGQMTVARILPDGSEQAALYTTGADLYSDRDMVSPAQVGQMYFGDEYIYFSYGGIGGSGMFFQGGRIIRMRYDGSQAQVVAGAAEKVGADFTVNAGGSVNAVTGDAAYTALFTSMNEYYFANGTVYLRSRTNGEREELISPADYSLVGPGLAGCAGPETVYIGQIQAEENRVYFMAHALVRDGVMWWAEYSRENSAFMMKDLETGAVEVLYTF